MTELDTEAIRARLAAIPAAPWELRCSEAWWISQEDDEREVVHMIGWEQDEWTEPVANFVVRAPEDIAALLAEVARLRGDLGMVAMSSLEEGWDRLVAENADLRDRLARVRACLPEMAEEAQT